MSGGQAFYHFAVQFPSDAPMPELGRASLAVARDDVSGFARLITLDARGFSRCLFGTGSQAHLVYRMGA
jgi:hypothetical protein